MRWILVDRLVSCVPGERVVATKSFPISDILFMDHFVGWPTVPGVLQIEMIAQAAGKCIKLARPTETTLLALVRSAKFYRRVEPGDQCRVTVEITRLRDDHALESGIVEVDGVRTAQAELLVSIVPAAGVFVDPVLEDWTRRQAKQDEHDNLEAGPRSRP
jgi:3-hydroxyacyl-[acyl-carrier-protein] dehydratase